MMARKVTALVALVAAITAGVKVRGLLLVTPKVGGGASIVAEGVRLYGHLWPALVAAGAAALTIAGTWLTYAAQDEARADLAADIEAANQERRRLEAWALGLEGATLELGAERKAGEATVKKAQAALDAERRNMAEALEHQRREVDRLRGELTGARNHVKRMKHQRGKGADMLSTREEIEAEVMQQFATEFGIGQAAFADGVIQGLKAAAQTLSGSEQMALIDLMNSLKTQMQATFSDPKHRR